MLGRPFQGLTFCCTAIPVRIREDIANKLVVLGGVHYSDLMSDVNYLIVGDRKTEKYRYCIKNRWDIKFVKTDAVLNIYNYWINGEVNRQLLDVDNYLMPVFEDMTVCLSRVEDAVYLLDAPFRKGWEHAKVDQETLARVINENGGKVTDFLTANNSCIVTSEEKGKRYSKAVEWNLPVVHPAWVVDSILRHAAMDFADYSFQASLNGCNVWEKLFQYRQTAAKDNEKYKTETTVAEVNTRNIKKDKRIWNEIMKKTANISREAAKDNTWMEIEEVEEEGDKENLGLEEGLPGPDKNLVKEKSKIFLGFKFIIIGFTNHEKSLIELIVHLHSGKTSAPPDPNITHIIVPAKLGDKHRLLLEDLAMEPLLKKRNVSIVTEWFLERSIYYKKIVQDSWTYPLEGAKPSLVKYKVCITGFTGIELLHLEKLLTYLNFEFCSTFTSDRDLLILNINMFKKLLQRNSCQLYEGGTCDFLDAPLYQSGSSSVATISTKNKVTAAKKWGIPIVSVRFILESLHSSSNSKSPNLKLANICDLRWCLFAPKNVRKNSMLEASLSREGETSSDSVPSEFESKGLESKEESKEESNEDELQLPSPRKGSRKRTYGRLSRKSLSESMKTRLKKAANDHEINPHDVSIMDDEDLSQVRYQDFDSLKNTEQLFEKLTRSLKK